MEIIIGKTAGFCFGVKNAVTKAEEAVEQNNEIYCLGELVHNKQVTENLVQKGIRFIDDITSAKGKTVIRSHGVEKKIYKQAKNMGIELIDLTCPKVLHIHNIAEEYAKKGFYIILTGDKEHPEMLGTASFCGEYYYILEKKEDIEKAIIEFKKSNLSNILLISQTTYSLVKFEEIAEELRKKIPTIEVINTICNATKMRQEETEQMAKNVDIMVIVGGKHSSNSNKLYELAKKYCSIVLFVETANEIEEKQVFLDKEKSVNSTSVRVGIMAGASTPKESINKVVEKLKEIWYNKRGKILKKKGR